MPVFNVHVHFETSWEIVADSLEEALDQAENNAYEQAGGGCTVPEEADCSFDINVEED